MTIWMPNLEDRGGPRYLAVADSLSDDVRRGVLEPGTRLPTHRNLAYRLGVTVGTVSRAYAEARRRGLISGEVGRGTFVRRGGKDDQNLHMIIDEGPDAGPYDFGLNLPAIGDSDQRLARTLTALGAEGGLAPLLEYHPDTGTYRHREAGARWIGRSGFEVSADRVVVCNGAQHGMALTFMTLTGPGDLVLTDALTYPGMRELAAMLRIRLMGLAMDEDGLRPDAFEEACRSHQPKALYCMPTLHNPIATIMPMARRQDIASIARRYGVAIVEDDVYGFLPAERPPPLSTLAPEISYYITSTSKSIAPGLRVGYVATPEGMAAGLGTANRATCRMATPLMVEIATRWIDDGTADQTADWQRREARARQQAATRILSGVSYVSHPESYHLWLPLPEPWTGGEFVAYLRRRGVVVIPSEAFTVGREKTPDAVRVCLGAVRGRERLEKGLTILAEALDQTPRPDLSVI